MNKPVIALVFLLFLPYATDAAQFKSYKITTEIEDGIVREDFLITLLNDGGSELKAVSLTLPRNAEVLSARDTYGMLPVHC
jgi:hypothetical protein